MPNEFGSTPIPTPVDLTPSPTAPPVAPGEGDIQLYDQRPEAEVLPEESFTQAAPFAATAAVPMPEGGALTSKAARVTYRLRIDTINQVVSAYTTGGELVRQMTCSTGEDETPTPLGTFSSGSQYRWGYFTQFDVWAQYWTRIDGPILFHSVLYKEQKEETLITGSVYNLGSRASHGCVRLQVEDGKWIYENCPRGTQVIIFEGPKNSAYNADVKKNGALEGTKLHRCNVTQPEGNPGVVTASSLNLRAQPNSSGEIVTKLPKNTAVTVVAEGDGWSTVFYQGVFAYASSEYLRVTKEPTDPAATTTGTIKTEGGTLNLRKSASADADILARLPNGATVDVLETLPEWLRVRYQGTIGYCSSKYIAVSGAGTDPADPYAYDSGTVTTSGSPLNLRAEPNAGSKVVTQIPNGANIAIAAYTDGWAKARYQRYTGYVSKQYLSGTKKG